MTMRCFIQVYLIDGTQFNQRRKKNKKTTNIIFSCNYIIIIMMMMMKYQGNKKNWKKNIIKKGKEKKGEKIYISKEIYLLFAAAKKINK